MQIVAHIRFEGHQYTQVNVNPHKPIWEIFRAGHPYGHTNDMPDEMYRKWLKGWAHRIDGKVKQ
jgi:hypothetical protein